MPKTHLHYQFIVEQIMANLFPTIVPGKILRDNTHKIRIALSHNCETRYIVILCLDDKSNNLFLKHCILNLRIMRFVK